MRTIHKAAIKVTDTQSVKLSPRDTILTVQVQCDQLCMWYVTDTEDRERADRVIRIFGTGHPMPDYSSPPLGYIGTIQLRDGALIFHVFQELP